MKKHLKIITAVLVLILAVGLVACNNTEKGIEKDVDADKQVAEEKVKEIEAQAKTDVENATEVSKEAIQKAVDYIDENIAKPAADMTDDVKEKLIYYGTYLKNVGEKAGTDVKHEVVKLGDNVSKFATNIYTKAEDEASDISKSLKSDIDSGLNAIKADKDKFIGELHELYETAKEKLDGGDN